MTQPEESCFRLPKVRKGRENEEDKRAGGGANITARKHPPRGQGPLIRDERLLVCGHYPRARDPVLQDTGI